MKDFQGIHFGFCVQQVPKGEAVTIKGHILLRKPKNTQKRRFTEAQKTLHTIKTS